jgi:hypothetical protein
VTSPDLPRPVTTDHKLLVALAVRLDTQNELLGRILDRLPEPPTVVAGDAVELREPAPPKAEPEPAAKAAPTRRTRKSTPKGSAPGKETT